MSLETHLGDACVVPLECRRLASGTDALAPLRQLALGVLYSSSGGQAGGKRRGRRWG